MCCLFALPFLCLPHCYSLSLSLLLWVHPNSLISYLDAPEIDPALTVIKDIPLTLLQLGGA